MPKAQTKASNKYNKKAYDRYSLMLPKGQKNIIRKYAEAQDLSLNAYINKLIEKDMKEE